ncbi:Retrotransposon gag protein [Corchorus capsularis]|uniref:Retrotransposon gag protein n=1 Tax=Corchorus capsularis TaxID=210143 RepID=A0A1R3HI86_COCAP|nr:Retrotransposon gag protein [Corchorus capsularis]
MANNEVARTLRELAAPDVTTQNLAIQYPTTTENFEIKSGFIQILPKFHGLSGEDPHRHLIDFQVACSLTNIQGISEEQFKLRTFPFTLMDQAKNWLYLLPKGSIISWATLKKLFLERYFRAHRVSSIRKEICGIKQRYGETMHEYWERFKSLCASCPNHQITEQLLIQYFFEGLLPLDRSSLDSSSGGAFIDKTPSEACTLVEKLATNTQQFGTRKDYAPRESNVRRVNAVSTDWSELNQHLKGMTQQISMLNELVTSTFSNVSRLCGICSQGHYTDKCPSLSEDNPREVNAMGMQGFQRKQDQFSNTYSSNWRYGNEGNFQGRPNDFQRPIYQPSSQVLEIQSMKETMEMMMKQMSQLASDMCELKSQSQSRIPSQPKTLPKENVNAITLRSGKELEEPYSTQRTFEGETSNAKEDLQAHEKEIKLEKDEPIIVENIKDDDKDQDPIVKTKLDSQVEINIPLLDAIQQMPNCARFLKQLCTNKKRLQGKVSVGAYVSDILRKNLPPKCKDPVRKQLVKIGVREEFSKIDEKITKGRQKIQDIRQRKDESFHQYWKRFKKLCEEYPQHGFEIGLLIQYFYNGLGVDDQLLVDSINHTPLCDQTPGDAYLALEALAQAIEPPSSRKELDKTKIGVNKQEIRASTNRNFPMEKSMPSTSLFAKEEAYARHMVRTILQSELMKQITMDHILLLQDIEKLHEEAKEDRSRMLKNEKATRESLDILDTTLKTIIELLKENNGFSSIFNE